MSDAATGAGDSDRALRIATVPLLVLHAYALGYLVRDLLGPPTIGPFSDPLSIAGKLGGVAFVLWLARYARRRSTRLGFLAAAGTSALLTYRAAYGDTAGIDGAVVALTLTTVVALAASTLRDE